MAGRKQKWDEIEMDEKLILVEGWARDGLSEKQIMENLGIGHNLFYRWKKDREEFREALKKGKEVSDREVENALYKRALGYEVEETKVFVDGDKRRVERTKKHIPPSDTSMIYWLKNRKPQEWNESYRLEHTGKNGEPIEVSDVSPREELKDKIEQMKGRKKDDE